MPDIQHKNMTDPDLHEPKGIATASSGDVYVADGAGSGVWQAQSVPVFGAMTITSNTTPFSVSAAVDSTLQTDTDYVKLTGAGAPWAGENLVGGLTFNTDSLVVPRNGYYIVQFYAVLSHSVNNSNVGFKYGVNGVLSTRSTQVMLSNAGRRSVVSGFGITPILSANDVLTAHIASDNSGDVTILNANLALFILKEV